ncbi:MAG: efflux RND transporter periplasmic adaptor subunit [Bacteroidota bacterium]
MKIIKTFIVIAIAGYVLASCSSNEAAENNSTTVESTAIEADTNVYLVKSQYIGREPVMRNLDFPANLEAFEKLDFAPQSPGRIEKIHVEVGDWVRKGDLIVEMDQTQLIQAMEQLQNAASNFQRLDTLYQLNSISEQQYEAAKTQYEVAKANVGFLKRNTTLTAPMNAIVTAKYFEGGELYSGAPNTAAGIPAIVTLMQINPLKAIINVPEKYYPLVKKGMKADVKLDVYPGERFSGEIDKVYPTINPQTRSFTVELKINNPDLRMRPGMFSRLSLNLGEEVSLVVPASALLQQQGTNNRYIFLSSPDGKAQKVNVTVTDRINGKVAIASDGLSEKQKVITVGQEKLMHGVTIKEVE